MKGENIMSDKFEMIKKIAEKESSERTTVDWNGVEISVKKTVSLDDMMSVVLGVVGSCFDEDGNYIPEVVDIIEKHNVIKWYTDIDVPNDINESFDLIYRTDLYQIVIGKIDQTQLATIHKAIREKIEYLVNVRADAVSNKCIELIGELSKVSDGLSTLFGDLKPEDMTNMIGAITGGKFDEEKLIKAYMKEKK